MTNEEYFNECAKLDWFYSFTDDARVYRAGQSAVNRIKGAAVDDTQRKMFSDWKTHMFSGPTWGTEKTAEPKLEDY